MPTIIIKDKTHNDLRDRSKTSGGKMSHLADMAIRFWLDMDRPLKSVVVKKRKGKI